MIISDIISTLEQFAPLPLQEEYDNSGLQVGTTQARVSGVLLCLDVTLDVVREAAELGCNLIVSHHPLLFHPLKRVVDSDYNSRIVMEALKNGISLYACHTNLDNAKGGVNWHIASIMGLQDCRPLEDLGNGNGSGLIGQLQEPKDEYVILSSIKRDFKTGCIRHNAPLGRPVKCVALCGGAGAFLIDRAVSQGADLFLTGEIAYHRFFGYDGVIKLVEAGHYETEQYTGQIIAKLLETRFPELDIHFTQCCTNPVNYLI